VDEVVKHVAMTDYQERVALAEIELCGELMIAASSASEEPRLSSALIDKVLEVDRFATDPRIRLTT
jgi:hypothetical protein